MLDTVNSPQDLRKLTPKQLDGLAEEIREKIIDVLSVNGGHLASNLGIVELTLALHFVFDSPNDKLIFDVSHQSYPHKLLTGRVGKFSTIRKHKGLCGFTHPFESPHDHFFAGHAGTALSLGLGSAKARDLKQEANHVIPILGDASLTCGLTLEALNNIPKDLSKFLVILNDNNMSISQNVGAIKNILSRFLSNPTSNKIFHEIESLLAKIPKAGNALAKQGHKWTESLKNLVSTAPFFEQFGLSYVGPIDGHDTAKLIDTLQALKEAPKPTLLHVLTTKGKGMTRAISNPTGYHGCKPFDKVTGIFHATKARPTFPKIFGKHLMAMAAKDPEVVAITPAMTAGSCLDDFLAKHPDRCFDVGIAEGHAVTFAGAMAKEKGLKVFCSIYATFLQRALDNLFHDVALQRSPVVFAIDRAGISGPDGSTHHGVYDISFLQAMPEMVICQPRNGHVLKELLESCFSWNKTTAIRYPNMATEEESTAPLQERLLGKGEILSKGKDLLIISLGHMNKTALELKNRLLEDGINPTIVDPVFVKPLDEPLFLELISSHKHVVTIEEHSLQGGLGSAVSAFMRSHALTPENVLHFGIDDQFLDHGSYLEVLFDAGLTTEQIYTSLKSSLKFSSDLAGMA